MSVRREEVFEGERVREVRVLGERDEVYMCNDYQLRIITRIILRQYLFP